MEESMKPQNEASILQEFVVRYIHDQHLEASNGVPKARLVQLLCDKFGHNVQDELSAWKEKRKMEHAVRLMMSQRMIQAIDAHGQTLFRLHRDLNLRGMLSLPESRRTSVEAEQTRPQIVDQVLQDSSVEWERPAAAENDADRNAEAYAQMIRGAVPLVPSSNLVHPNRHVPNDIEYTGHFNGQSYSPSSLPTVELEIGCEYRESTPAKDHRRPSEASVLSPCGEMSHPEIDAGICEASLRPENEFGVLSPPSIPKIAGAIHSLPIVTQHIPTASTVLVEPSLGIKTFMTNVLSGIEPRVELDRDPEAHREERQPEKGQDEGPLESVQSEETNSVEIQSQGVESEKLIEFQQLKDFATTEVHSMVLPEEFEAGQRQQTDTLSESEQEATGREQSTPDLSQQDQRILQEQQEKQSLGEKVRLRGTRKEMTGHGRHSEQDATNKSEANPSPFKETQTEDLRPHNKITADSELHQEQITLFNAQARGVQVQHSSGLEVHGEARASLVSVPGKEMEIEVVPQTQRCDELGRVLEAEKLINVKPADRHLCDESHPFPEIQRDCIVAMPNAQRDSDLGQFCNTIGVETASRVEMEFRYEASRKGLTNTASDIRQEVSNHSSTTYSFEPRQTPTVHPTQAQISTPDLMLAIQKLIESGHFKTLLSARVDPVRDDRRDLAFEKTNSTELDQEFEPSSEARMETGSTIEVDIRWETDLDPDSSQPILIPSRKRRRIMEIAPSDHSSNFDLASPLRSTHSTPRQPSKRVCTPVRNSLRPSTSMRISPRISETPTILPSLSLKGERRPDNSEPWLKQAVQVLREQYPDDNLETDNGEVLCVDCVKKFKPTRTGSIAGMGNHLRSKAHKDKRDSRGENASLAGSHPPQSTSGHAGYGFDSNTSRNQVDAYVRKEDTNAAYYRELAHKAEQDAAKAKVVREQHLLSQFASLEESSFGRFNKIESSLEAARKDQREQKAHIVDRLASFEDASKNQISDLAERISFTESDLTEAKQLIQKAQERVSDAEEKTTFKLDDMFSKLARSDHRNIERIEKQIEECVSLSHQVKRLEKKLRSNHDESVSKIETIQTLLEDRDDAIQRLVSQRDEYDNHVEQTNENLQAFHRRMEKQMQAHVDENGQRIALMKREYNTRMEEMHEKFLDRLKDNETRHSAQVQDLEKKQHSRIKRLEKKIADQQATIEGHQEMFPALLQDASDLRAYCEGMTEDLRTVAEPYSPKRKEHRSRKAAAVPRSRGP